ncbi:UTP--glucose-1-phosphate uridylyltransferase [Desulfonema ishimotonii]|uniref:UTP--glucose-1-phosphate uridylyltransferase n=2 Tax=Desulfonema ishimotonii TaxID=45657 RepID=A0A401G1R4_9BACT|nr:UTP--glucose-1-phosphate uridylyltransferase [Desulfonema ishimotonii]
MEKDGLPPIVIDTFAYYYDKVITGETGLIRDDEIEAVDPDDIARWEALAPCAGAGKAARRHTVHIILNGGLGTSMGLTGPKSLLRVRNGRSFLEILLAQTEIRGVSLALMNSFSTHEDTLAALKAISPAHMPLSFLQHKFPKILRDGFAPATWPRNPEMEWNPPGHGDIYTALETSGMLDRLLASGITHAFISNSDNLGAKIDDALLGYFAEEGFPFMMEVARRTPADVKGGHLARHRDGHLLLRESAQCPADESDAFRDIDRYRFFNTNNLWVDLRFLKTLIQKSRTVRLPMILNPKFLDPRDESSPPVFQVETAMGAAISLFEGATAVSVPRTRFFPVKKCGDLLAVRSDYFLFSEGNGLVLNPARRSDTLKISLDPRYYGKIDQFDARFPQGVPSLVECESLTVEGDVRFEGGVRIRGTAGISNASDSQQVIREGSVVRGEFSLSHV